MSLITTIRRKSLHVKCCRVTQFYVFVVVAVTLFLIMVRLPVADKMLAIRIMDTNYTYKNLMNDLKNSIVQNEGRVCEIPLPELKKVPLQTKVDHAPCEGTDWVECFLNECMVIEEIRKSTKDLFCIYQDMFYVNDFWYDVGKPVKLPGNISYKLRKSDHVKVSCNGVRMRFPELRRIRNLHNYSFSFTEEFQWVGYKAGFRRLPPLDPPINDPNFNILILGFNCMSHAAFIREMKESYAVLRELDAVFLNGYSTVDEGTSAAFFPLFFGKSELQFPKDENACDDTSCIFKHLSNSGYRTAFLMDSIDDFQRHFEDFNKIPDHYLYPLLLEAYNSRSVDNNLNLCMGIQPLYKLMLELTFQFFQQTGKHFSFTFMGSTCNDEVSMNYVVDPYLAYFLRRIRQRRMLEKTVLLIMGDHGPKYGPARQHDQGRLEERLPLMAIVVPDDLKRTRPEAWKALDANKDVLTTPFDIHSTLLDILGMGDLRNQEKVPMSSLPRGMTLLQPIPKTRTCGEAGILPHWCPCMFQPRLDIIEPMYLKVSFAINNYINNITMDHRDLCAVRQLTSIVRIERQSNHKHIGKVRAMGEFYQAVIKVSPDRAVFEATLTYFEKEKYFEINPRYVTRISAPGDTAACINKKYPHLNDYCYCKNQTL